MSNSQVCQKCQVVLGNPWRDGGNLCWQCGSDYDLFHPETRWIDDSDSRPVPALRIRLQQPWWRRVFAHLRQVRLIGALRSFASLLMLCVLLPSSSARADDCSESLMAEACACRSPVSSNRERPATSEKRSESHRQSKIVKSTQARPTAKDTVTTPATAMLSR